MKPRCAASAASPLPVAAVLSTISPILEDSPRRAAYRVLVAEPARRDVPVGAGEWQVVSGAHVGGLSYAGLLPDILATMRPDNEPAFRRGCRTLLGLLQNGAPPLLRAEAAGAARALVAGMRLQPCVAAQRDACAALRSLAHNGGRGPALAERLRAIRRAGGISAAASAMQEHPENEALQRLGCQLLLMASSSHDTRVST